MFDTIGQDPALLCQKSTGIQYFNAYRNIEFSTIYNEVSFHYPVINLFAGKYYNHNIVFLVKPNFHKFILALDPSLCSG